MDGQSAKQVIATGDYCVDSKESKLASVPCYILQCMHSAIRSNQLKMWKYIMSIVWRKPYKCAEMLILKKGTKKAKMAEIQWRCSQWEVTLVIIIFRNTFFQSQFFL